MDYTTEPKAPTLVGLLVGMHFYPPSKLLLANLPAGTSLRLEPEPTNPYDEHAIKVLVEPSAVPEDLREATAGDLAGHGYTWEELLAEGERQIGHVAKTGGKPLEGTGYSGNLEIAGARRATLGFDGQGRAILRIGPKEPMA